MQLCVTVLSEAGCPRKTILNASGHKSVSVLRSAIRAILQIFIVCQNNMPKEGAYYGFYKCMPERYRLVSEELQRIVWYNGRRSHAARGKLMSKYLLHTYILYLHT